MRKILGCIKRAQNEFQMIQKGDVVAVGLSGGKDSMALVYALHLFQNFAPVPYTLKAITIDLGFKGFDLRSMSDYCGSLGVEHIVEPTQIGRLVFEERQESNPCSLCARMRRGRINRVCDEKGITKLALGHHGDDAVETLFMNMLFESRIASFNAVTSYERASVTMIRPMIFASEKDVADAADRHNIPVVKNPCPASGFTKRETVKRLLAQFDETVPDGKKHMIDAVCKLSSQG